MPPTSYDDYAHERRESDRVRSEEMARLVDAIASQRIEFNAQIGQVLGRFDGLSNSFSAVGQKIAVMEVELRAAKDWQSAVTRIIVGFIAAVALGLFYAMANGAGVHLK
jgi:hypothetical protein